MSVRFASRTAVTSTRSGSTVSITATTSRYASSGLRLPPVGRREGHPRVAEVLHVRVDPGQDRHDGHEGGRHPHGLRLDRALVARRHRRHPLDLGQGVEHDDPLTRLVNPSVRFGQLVV